MCGSERVIDEREDVVQVETSAVRNGEGVNSSRS
jgi:hypothetical protein